MTILSAQCDRIRPLSFVLSAGEGSPLFPSHPVSVAAALSMITNIPRRFSIISNRMEAAEAYSIHDLQKLIDV